ncbi:uncharacterized protein F5891DRAFT_988195 [Suillus fuscotomentosus]|uniref:Uncharacterized protein n=1 Tax=Suillus fuscotomentosus TaxID=1912939 RepID=A0AAD4DP65_9AGAM|nr:uncharacterized protein F5891DRAFT_988195 [Suillus fuscotomentosus]KAG1887494.1 hypothetical protein F5891DRAFT_988195 [Suillus fuscotomentosus]
MSSTSSDSLPTSPRPSVLKSPMWRSLYALCTTAAAINSHTVSRQPFTFKFPVRVNLVGQFNHTGPYSNLPHTGLDLGALKKMCAQFELRQLEEHESNEFPPEAIRCSVATMESFNVLHGEAEDAGNALLLGKAFYPQDMSFWRKYKEGGRKCLSTIMTTDPLVVNILDPSQSSMPHLRWSDIGNMQESILCSRAVPQGVKDRDQVLLMVRTIGDLPWVLTDAGDALTTEDNLLSDLPNPLGWYAGLVTQYNLQCSKVDALIICDIHGDLIHPQEYRMKLVTGDIGMVECQLKLDGNPEERNGMRRYQVMLKEMKVLPDASITAKMFNDYMGDAKGKHKATNDLDEEQAHKKSQTDKFSNNLDFVEDNKVEIEGHEMLVTED